MTERNFKPGQKAPTSGQYEMLGPRGGHSGIERTVVKKWAFSSYSAIRANLCISRQDENEVNYGKEKF